MNEGTKMGIYLRGGNVFIKNRWEKWDVILEGGRIAAFVPSDREFLEDGSVIENQTNKYERVIDCDNSFLLPGFLDVHVHLREPGFEYKETIKTGTTAAAAGGFTGVCAMPNVNPTPDCLAGLGVQLDAIKRDAVVPVYPFGRITRGNQGSQALSDMEALAPWVIGYTDDGFGVQTRELMEKAMERAKKLGKVIAAHCESEALTKEGNIRESEWRQVERDLALCEKTGCDYHVCHVSTKESLDLIRRAKKAGINVTCETAPHYLIFCRDDCKDDGRFKMNPPLMEAADREALIAGVADGTVDMIATDHAPHSGAEKSKGYNGSLNGVVGLETAFPVLYSQLVMMGKVLLERLVDAMATAPRKRFGLPGGTLQTGEPADLCLWDLTTPYSIDSEEFVGKGKSTPFQGMEVLGRNKMTIVGGTVVWERS